MANSLKQLYLKLKNDENFENFIITLQCPIAKQIPLIPLISIYPISQSNTTSLSNIRGRYIDLKNIFSIPQEENVNFKHILRGHFTPPLPCVINMSQRIPYAYIPIHPLLFFLRVVHEIIKNRPISTPLLIPPPIPARSLSLLSAPSPSEPFLTLAPPHIS